MKTSEKTDELMEALAKAQGKFSNVKASADNPFHKSKYAPLDAVISMFRPIMAEQELTIIHGVVHGVVEGNATAYLQTRISHKSGQWIEDDGAPLLVRTKDKTGKTVEPTMQNLMAAVTYAKRLGGMALLALAATEEDDDGEAVQSNWAGPLTKTKLAAAGHDLHNAIIGAKSTVELREVQVEHMDVIEQLRHDLPKWWYGDGDEIHGAQESINTRRLELEETESEIEDIV